MSIYGFTDKSDCVIVFACFQYSGRNKVYTRGITVRGGPNKNSVYKYRVGIYDTTKFYCGRFAIKFGRNGYVFTEPMRAVIGIKTVCASMCREKI